MNFDYYGKCYINVDNKMFELYCLNCMKTKTRPANWEKKTLHAKLSIRLSVGIDIMASMSPGEFLPYHLLSDRFNLLLST